MKWRQEMVAVSLFISVLLLSNMWGWGATIEARERSETSFFLSLQGNALSVKSERAPLGEVLAELARQAQLKVYATGSVTAEEVSVEFHHLPLDEGIRRILKGKNYVLGYAQPLLVRRSRGSPKLVEIHVFAQEGESSMRTVGEGAAVARPSGIPRVEQPKPLQELLQEATEASDPRARAAALEALSDRDDEKEEMLPTIVAALRDTDPHVREVALEVLEEVDVPVPLEVLAEVALTDTSPQLRISALQLLADTDKKAALDPLRRARQDPDRRVRELAGQLLQALQGREQ